MSDLLDSVQFRAVPLLDVFDSMKASSTWYDKVHLEDGDGENLYLSQTLRGNSVAGVVADQKATPEPGNCITVTLKTQATFYQPVPFYTAQNFLIFRHEELDEATGLVLVAAMRKVFEKFSWGYGISMARLARMRIIVPVTTNDDGDDVVDWDGMERLGRELTADARAKAAAARPKAVAAPVAPPALTFAPMLITDVFDTYHQSPAWLNISEVRSGKPRFPHVTNSANTNSVAGFVGMQSVPPNPGNAITIGIDTQVAAYQPVPFYGATKVFELRSSRLTEASALLLVTSLKRAMEKFSWGHKASAARLQRTRIMVPVTTGHKGASVVDWDGMERYGKWLIARADGHIAEALR